MRRDRIEKYAQILEISPEVLIGNGGSEETAPDPDLAKLRQAKKRMSAEEWQRMMVILAAAFPEYFRNSE